MNTFLAAATETASSGNPIADLAHQFGVEWPLLIAQIVSFTAVAFILYKFAFKPVLMTIEERQAKIKEGLDYTEQMKVELAESEVAQKEALRKASQEAQRIIGEAKQSAEERISQSTQEAARQAEDVLKKAEAQIELDRKQMIAEARSEIARLVVATTGKVLSKDLSDQEKSQFTTRASEELVDSGA